MTPQKKRGSWSSTLGFILATSGAAIGLGNIQRFPYITAEGGGAAFVLIYLACVLLLGLPLILVEFSIGRHTERNPVCALEKLRPRAHHWKAVGFLGVLTAFFILTYYSVIGGWTLGYIVEMGLSHDVSIKEFAADPVIVLGYMALFLAITMLILMKGVKKGIERYSKIFMPILFVLLIILVARSLTLPGSFEGIKFYLQPDFSEVTWKTWLLALGQAFFSLSIGEAVLITYGSYASKKENLPLSASYIVLFDLLIALLAGFIIFPALASFGFEPKQGMGLTFIVLPKVFLMMPFGAFFGALFFLLLAFAAITTAIALLEMPVIYLIDSWHWTRKKAVWVMGTLAFLIGIPSALSRGSSERLSNMTLSNLPFTGFYEIMDFIWGNLGMVITGGLLAIFTGWVWGTREASKELEISCKSFAVIRPYWAFAVKFLAPIFIVIILLSLFFN